MRVRKPSVITSLSMQGSLALGIAAMPGVAVAGLRDLVWPDAGVARSAIASALLVAFVYGLVLRRAEDRLVALRWLNLRALPLLGSPLVLLLLDPNVARSRGGLVLASICALAAMFAVSRLHGGEPSPRRFRFDIAGVALVAACVAGWLSWLAWVRHASMQTNTYDFGLFVNAIWNTAQGRAFECTLVPTGSILDEHVSLALLPLAALMKLGLPPTGILVVQASWICAGAVPMYLLARRHLGSTGGRVFAVAYLLHPAVHVNALWDFHPLSLAAPLIVTLVLYGGRRRVHPGFVLSVAALLMLREEMAFVVIAFAGSLAMGGRSWRSLALVVVAITFLVELNVVMGQTSSHLSRYADVAERGGRGLSGMVLAILFDPAFVIGYALSFTKVVYVGVQSVGVLGLAGLCRRAWPMLALAVAFPLLATSGHVYNPFFHYTTMLYPVVLAWAPAGLSRLAAVPWSRAPRAIRRRALLVAVLVASVLSSLTFGGLHHNPVFRAGFQKPRREVSEKAIQRLAWLMDRLDEIPDDVPIAVTGRVGPHAATRRNVFEYPPDRDVEIMLVSRSDLREESKTALREAVRAGSWVLADTHGSLLLYRRQRQP